MKRKILETRRQVVRAIIEAFPGGRELAATWLGMDLKKFDNHAYESSNSRPLSDDQLLSLEQHAGTYFYADHIAHQYGGVFIPLPPVEKLDNLHLYARAIRSSVKRGAVDRIIAKALDDGEIDADEAKAIRKAFEAYVAESYAEVLAVIQLHSARATQ